MPRHSACLFLGLLAILSAGLPPTAWGVGGEGLLVPLENWTVLSDTPTGKAVKALPPAVLLVPGMMHGDETMSAIRFKLRELAIPTAMFRYDSQLGADRVATRLAAILAAEAERLPSRRIVLVTHSMGGVVARCVVEDPRWNLEIVSHLIMIAPPNAGSTLADLSGSDIQGLLDAFRTDEVKAIVDENAVGMITDTLDMFLGNAKKDLSPGSELMKRLATYERNPSIRYSIIAGTQAPIPPLARSIGQLILRQLRNERPEAAVIFQKVLIAADRDEWIRGLGDGAVAVSSTRLSGVADHITLPFAHRDTCQVPADPATRELIEQVMLRIPR